jgi:hypothetical protein
MFRVKTRRNGKHSSPAESKERVPSPPPTLPPSPPLPTVAPALVDEPQPDISGSGSLSLSLPSVSDTSLLGSAMAAVSLVPGNFMARMTNFFEAESVAASTTKPWLRLERGLRLQKLRTFAEAYPGLTLDEKETLCKTLAKANDAKLLNTKQQIVYENGKILSIRGLKVVRSGDVCSFKIEVHRQTKKRGNE